MSKRSLEQLLYGSLYQRVNVKIGSKQGSSFFYCGKGCEAVAALEKTITQSMRKQMNKAKKNSETRLANLDELYEERFTKTLQERKIKNPDLYYQNLMATKERERVSLPKKIADYDYCIRTHLLDRPVLEIVDGISPDEKPCKIIYIKGRERGAYWTIEEYNKKHRKASNNE